MSKKSRKQRKKQRTKANTQARARETATPARARPAEPEALAEQVVGAVVEQVMHAIEDVLPEPAHGAQAHPESGTHAKSTTGDDDTRAAPEAHEAREAPEAHEAEAAEAREAHDAHEENRRKHPRVAMKVEIDLSSESHFFSGLSGDVSEGGVFVETYRDIPVGSEVALEFDLPNGTVSAHGAVKWHRDKSDSSPPGVGVEFEELSDEGKALIVDFCAKRAPLYYEVAS